MHTYRLKLDVIDGLEKILTISKQSFSVNWRQFHQTSSPIFFVYNREGKSRDRPLLGGF